MLWHEARHEKRCDPVILDLGQILGEIWTFLPKQRVILMNLEFVDPQIKVSLAYLVILLWIGSELSTNIYMIERKVPFF